MYKLFFILFTLILHNTVKSEEIPDRNKVYVTTSGFITSTLFSNQNWYENTYLGAINLDVFYCDYVFRTQITSDDESSISRITLEKNIFIKENNELMVRVGRFPRLVSFYNTVNDSPGTYDIAMVPLGVYNRRILKSKEFNSIDGINLLYTLSNSNNNNQLKVYLNYGKSPVINHCNVQQEYSYDKCIPNYEFQSDDNDYDVGISYENDDITLIASNTNVQFKTKFLDKTNPTSYYVSTITDKLIANVSKLGIKYNNNKTLLQSEFSFHNYSTITPLGISRNIQKAETFYILGKYNWLDNFSTNLQYSYSRSSYLGNYVDRSIGLTYIYKTATISLDRHVGSGIEWKKYLAEDPNWNSTVLSISYNF